MALDHQMYTLGSAGIGFVTYIIYEASTKNIEMEALIYSSATVFGLGILKESTDATGFHFTGIGANQSGALISSITAYYLRKWAKNRIRRSSERERQLERSIYNKK